MKWTKQRKITGAILTLAGLGFGADQLFFSGGAESAEAAAQTASASAPAAGPRGGAASAGGAAGTQAPAQHSGALLARRLEQASSDAGYSSIGDAFRPPASWFPKPEAPQAAAKSAPDKPQVEAGLQFKAKHRLIGVMRSGPAGSKQGLAVISGPSGSLTVRVGEMIDGAMLTGVEEGSIKMAENGQEFGVDLPRPGLGSTAVAQ